MEELLELLKEAHIYVAQAQKVLDDSRRAVEDAIGERSENPYGHSNYVSDAIESAESILIEAESEVQTAESYVRQMIADGM